VNVAELFFGKGSKSKHDVVYALVYAHCTEPVTVEAETWFMDLMSIFVNGKQAAKWDNKPKFMAKYHRGSIRLNKGANPILLRIGPNPWHWWFQFRLRGKAEDLSKVELKLSQ
jgi:hypothetical protein